MGGSSVNGIRARWERAKFAISVVRWLVGRTKDCSSPTGAFTMEAQREPVRVGVLAIDLIDGSELCTLLN